LNVPDSVGVPLMVIVFPAQVAVTPVGKPVGVPIPVAKVVVCVILGDKAVLIHKLGVYEATPGELIDMVIVPVALTAPQPPVKGML
jgi:hypothetical protein